MSISQYIEDEIKKSIEKRDSLNRDDYDKAAKEKYASDAAEEQDLINSFYDKSEENVNATNAKAVGDAKAEYDSLYLKNSVQNEINQMKIAQNMANLGLTDSGLNRTQQTAAQLSYANQKGDIDLSRQSELENLRLQLNEALTEIESNRQSDLLTSKQKWDYIARSEAETNYNNDIAAINSNIASAYEQYGNLGMAKIEAEAEFDANYVSDGKGGYVKKDSNADGSGNTYKLTDTEIKKVNELYTQNGGGEKGENAVLDYLEQKGKMPANETEMNIVESVYKDAEIPLYYQDWTISNDTKNYNFLWLSPDDNNDEYSNGTDTMTFKQLKKAINNSDLSEEEKEKRIDALRKQSKK